MVQTKYLLRFGTESTDYRVILIKSARKIIHEAMCMHVHINTRKSDHNLLVYACRYRPYSQPGILIVYFLYLALSF